MGRLLNIQKPVHEKIKRDYFSRMANNEVECASIARRFDKDFFDGKREHGYGGYKYDGRFYDIAVKISQHYKLKPGCKVLEIGCAKGFLLIEFMKIGMDVFGIDKSDYAINNAHKDIKDKVTIADVTDGLPFDDNYFDLIISKETLPHLPMDSIEFVLSEVIRCSKSDNIFFEIQGANTEEEKKNMYLWDKTHKIIFSEDEWLKLFNKVGLNGDYHFKVLIPEKK